MCGIAGFLLKEGPARLSTVKSMCDAIRHRGPDDEGFHVDGGCAIGMRRLSIIDLSTGHQPISNEDGSVWVVFNGEIYNYKELRDDLLARGHRFVTESDTETLVHLYEQEGVEGLARLRGMFSYCIWDKPRRRIMLARDRFGKKPLYYAVLPTGIYFASELKCLRVAGVPSEVDPEALRLYFMMNYIPDPWTAFRSIRRLPAGSWLLYDQASGTERIGKYWELPVPAESAPANLTQAQAAASLRDIFDESVRIRMMADVPLGAFLSGGLDSSSVVASMARQSSDPVKTFSIGFEEATFNELGYASLVAKKYGTEHHEILVKPDSVSLVNRMVRHFDEPFADESAIPTFVVSEFAARYVKVALSGDGGDESLGGYESFFNVERWRAYDRIPQWLRHVARWLAGKVPYSFYGKNYLRLMGQPSALERYFDGHYTPFFLRQRLLLPEWMLPADAGHLWRIMPRPPLVDGGDVMTQAMYFESSANLTGDMLVKVDRMSMANSLEVRCPLLDHKLVEFACTLPHHWKIRNSKGKLIFLEAIGDRLPPELLTRGKMGFGVPLESWFRGSLRELLHDHLTDARFLSRDIVSPDFLRALLAEHDQGRRDNHRPLWALLMLDLWFRELEPAAAGVA